MERGDTPRGPIPIVSSPTLVFPIFDQDGFELQRASVNQLAVNGVEDALFPSVSDQHNEMPLRRSAKRSISPGSSTGIDPADSG
jgi:hypothetical protein